MVLYAIQSEIRFGRRARTMRTGAADRKSTLAVSLCAAVPIVGFVLAMKANSSFATLLPRWFRGAVLPGAPVIAWVGVVFAACGVALRLWAVLKLRERYTRTLFIQHEHAIERGVPTAGCATRAISGRCWSSTESRWPPVIGLRSLLLLSRRLRHTPIGSRSKTRCW